MRAQRLSVCIHKPFDYPVNLAFVGQHCVLIAVQRIVEINIDRQPRHIKNNQIDCRPALQSKPVRQKSLFVDKIQYINQAKHFFQIVANEVGLPRQLRHIFLAIWHHNFLSH